MSWQKGFIICLRFKVCFCMTMQQGPAQLEIRNNYFRVELRFEVYFRETSQD